MKHRTPYYLHITKHVQKCSQRKSLTNITNIEKYEKISTIIIGMPSYSVDLFTIFESYFCTLKIFSKHIAWSLLFFYSCFIPCTLLGFAPSAISYVSSLLICSFQALLVSFSCWSFPSNLDICYSNFALPRFPTIYLHRSPHYNVYENVFYQVH